jgi:hypothetical protein
MARLCRQPGRDPQISRRVLITGALLGCKIPAQCVRIDDPELLPALWMLRSSTNSNARDSFKRNTVEVLAVQGEYIYNPSKSDV